MLVKLFIDSHWFTVPLKGKLERLDNGKKTIPDFEKDWRDKYSKNFNTKETKLAGAITGQQSGIVAIDCDNDVTYKLFKAFDPDYAFHFVSLGKPQGGGTIIYKYTSEVGQFKLANDDIKLDFYSDDGFVYLPTEGNNTKVSWKDVTELPELREVPLEIIAILKTFKTKVPTLAKDNKGNRPTVISNRLAPMLDNFIAKGKYDPTLFKIITPYSFRDLPQYVSKGHLHPNDVPLGRGSEYLSKISAILGADISVSVELYTNVMMLINSLWDDPIEKGKLNATIINPMIEGRSNIDGVTIWQYDEHWQLMGFVATSLNGDYIESFYDDTKGLYYLINYTVPYVKTYGDKAAIIKTLKTLLGRPLTEGAYDSTKQLIRTITNPALEFGHLEATDKFNMFRQTPELNVLVNPDTYKDQYVRPNTIIRYFDSLVPDDVMRAYLLSFIKTKLTTFSYSPVVLYFIGAPGSGKDTLVNILGMIIGQNYVVKPDTKVFLEQFNGWLIDKYIVQLDEYGNKLTRGSDKQEVLGKLKAWTGSDRINVRAMRQDSFDIDHSLTFIMTANKNPLPVEVDDRRFAFFKTPNILANQIWVNEAGGITEVIKKIKSEIMDFCYFLATEINVLHGDKYTKAPETEDREDLILDNLPAAEQIVFYINNNKYKELLDLAYDYGIDDLNKGWEHNKLWEDHLGKLYDAMTDGAGQMRTITRMLKGIGLKREHTSKEYNNAFFYYKEGLNKFAKDPDNGGFKPVSDDVAPVGPITIKGLGKKDA